MCVRARMCNEMFLPMLQFFNIDRAISEAMFENRIK